MAMHWKRSLALLACALALLPAGVGRPPLVSSATAASLPASSRGPIGPWIRGLSWVNAPALNERDLDGHVVLVEFWALDCINCQRTTPAMRQLSRDYRGRDLILLGMHTPELEQERDHTRLKQEVARLGIDWRIGMDDHEVAWRAFDNHAWPALYLIDRQGRVSASHIGELHVGTPAWKELHRRIDGLLATRSTGTD